MNVRPEAIRYLSLPELDIDPQTLPVEKRLFLVWVVNPTYMSDQIAQLHTSVGAGIEGWVAYTVPEYYNFLVQAISCVSDDVADNISGISVTINGNNQPIYLAFSGGGFNTYQYAMPVPLLHMKPDDTVEVQYDFAGIGHTVTTKIMGLLYEVGPEE